MNREKQISEMTKTISEMYSVYDTTAEDIAQGLFEKGYRKMDEVTLRLDLGDRTAEEIKQIAEAFNGLMKNSLTVADTMDDGLRLSLETEKERIREETAQDILESIFFNPNIKLSPELTATIEKLADEYLRADSKISLEELRAKRKYQIGKDAAKEILQEWIGDNKSMGVSNTFVKNIAEKYGVEVEE